MILIFQGFNANMEFENCYDWAEYIISNCERFTNMYRTNIFPSVNYTIDTFLYQVLNFDKQDSKMMEEFLEYRAF